uniref:Wall-associated receptor kinase galacturonan-binding domain-containing protein n=1 Tax=Lotus japonicus TaxID=34305 RepID=I3SEF7_LOTJA|nr:unknown [Lotus japonicus]
MSQSPLFFPALHHYHLIFLSALLITSCSSTQANSCRTYCGNITVDYPFATQYGCGHPGFRDLLFCINDVLMLHIASGSYRVLEIDYAWGLGLWNSCEVFCAGK